MVNNMLYYIYKRKLRTDTVGLRRKEMEKLERICYQAQAEADCDISPVTLLAEMAGVTKYDDLDSEETYNRILIQAKSVKESEEECDSL